MDNQYRKLTFALLVTALTLGCTRRGAPLANVTLVFAKSSAMRAQSFDPAAYCYVADIQADDIAPAPAKTCDPAFGITAGSVDSSQTLELDVPKGAARRLTLYAIPKSGVCPDVAQGFAGLARDRVYVLAKREFEAKADVVQLAVDVADPSAANDLVHTLGLAAACPKAAPPVTAPPVTAPTGTPLAVTAVSYGLTTPTEDTNVKRISGFGSARSVAIRGNQAFVATDTHGVVEIDVTDPAAPASIQEFMSGVPIQKLLVSGNYLYVLRGSDVAVVDISNPLAPALATTVAGVGSTNMVIGGNTLYVISLGGTVSAIDVTVPASASLISTLTLASDSHPFDAAVRGSYLFIANGWEANKGFAVVDVSNPSAMNAVYTGSLGVAGLYATGIAISGSYAYVSHGNVAVHVVHLANPAAPTVATSLNGFAGMSVNSRLAVSGGVAYVLNEGTYNLSRLDLAVPVNPTALAPIAYGSNSFLCAPCTGSDLVATTSRIYLSAIGDAPGFYSAPASPSPAAGGLSMSSITPTTGLVAGTTVTVTGADFHPTTTATFCGTPVAFNYTSPIGGTFTAPAMPVSTMCRLILANPSGVYTASSMMLVY